MGIKNELKGFFKREIIGAMPFVGDTLSALDCQAQGGGEEFSFGYQPHEEIEKLEAAGIKVFAYSNCLTEGHFGGASFTVSHRDAEKARKILGK